MFTYFLFRPNVNTIVHYVHPIFAQSLRSIPSHVLFLIFTL